MKCDETRMHLAAYMHNEVTQSEKSLIQTHLAGCDDCRQLLENLGNVEEQLMKNITEKAERVSPPEYAWESLQAQIGNGGSTVGGRRIFGKSLAAQGASRRLAWALAVLLLLVLLSPPAWALAGRLREWLGSYSSFKVQDLAGGIGGFEAFTPYAPTYLPKGFNGLGLGGTTGPDFDQFELTFSQKDRFVTLLQRTGTNLTAIPEGDPISILGQNGVYLPGFAESAQEVTQKFPGISTTVEFDYSQIDVYVWDMGEIRMELITNLPYEEALRIAQSLELMESSSGETQP